MRKNMPVSNLDVWIVILGGGLITYALRLSFIAFVATNRLPPGVRRGLRFVPPAVLAAIAFPQLLIRESGPMLNLSNHQLLAGGLAFAVGLLFRNPWITIASGLAALWALSLT